MLGVGLSFAQQNLCTIKISTDKKGRRSVLLAGANAAQLLEKYKEEAEKKGIKLDLRSLEVYVWDGKKLNSYSLGWGTIFSGESPMATWKKKLSNVEAKINNDELSKAHKLGWDIVCIGEGTPAEVKETKETKEVKKGECSDTAKNHINLGVGFINNKQIDNAIKEFEAAIKESPSCALAYANLVSAHVLKKNYNIAVDNYLKGVEKAGDDGFLHITGAIAYTYKKDYDLALQALDKALAKGFRDKSVLEGKDLRNLFLKRKAEFCKIMDKYSVVIKGCI
jgi:tetratricopeptide (TPR) repeat protein